jgi:hypothetical protein
MIAPGSLFKCGFTIESIAQVIDDCANMQPGSKTGARVRSAWAGYTLQFANIP